MYKKRKEFFMMKKNGFTLAEVLITLAIIGVVATLTLPSLMTNTGEQQAVTAYRKAINTLNEAGQMSAAVDGFDYSQLSDGATPPSAASTLDENGIPKQSLWSLLVNRTQVDIPASVAAKVPGECNGKSQVFFRDGTVLCYTPAVTAGANADIQAFIDTNGTKGPNLLSTCGDEQCLQGQRSIKDQFRVTLHGSNAIPGHVTWANGVPTEDQSNAGFAARWAMRK